MLRPDVFRCDSCGTEYYLDNNDININYTVRQVPPAPVPAPAKSLSPRLVVLSALAVVAFSMAMLGLLHHPEKSGYQAVSTGGTVVAGSDDDEKRTFEFRPAETHLYQVPDHGPELLAVGGRNYSGIADDTTYAVFENAATGAVLRSEALPVKPAFIPTGLDLKAFSNGDLYVLLDKKLVLKANPVAHTFTDVTKTLFAGQPELGSGVATVEAGYNYEGDGFRVFTNDGRNLYYYPLLHKVYTKDQFYDAQYGMASLRPGSPLRTGFTFSNKSTTYPDEKTQLLKYQYRDNTPGPTADPRFEWEDDYGGSGVFTDADPHQKVLMAPSDRQRYRVVSFHDFTPGRLYFDPVWLYDDADYVLLTFRPTAAEDSPLSVQCLNARTAAVMWTLPLPEADDPSQALRTAEGFVLADRKSTYTISLTGKLLGQRKI